ncbi:MAG: glycosyltransferase family 9 protein [Planctomycetes bacterium]|jgi:ADP-heptose:LPS heptosyltransferase|nr:glycosyltransferase family 9 protein [Planctomycetota bacterium]
MSGFRTSFTIGMATVPVKTPRILLVRLSAIGDVVHALFGVAALRAVRAGAFIGFLVEDRAASLLTGHPDLDRVHVYRRSVWQRGALREPVRVASEAGRFLAELRGERYDVAVDLQGNLKGAVLAALSGAPRRIGLPPGEAKEWSHCLHTESVTVPNDPLHRVERVYRLLEPLGVKGAGGIPRVEVPARDREDVAAWLTDRGLPDGGFAVLHPGTSGFGSHKRWPVDRFGGLAAELSGRHGLRSVATWGPGEEELADRVVGVSRGAAIRGPRTRTLTALAELASRSALFVAADTGALHLAALLGAPTIGLFGPKDPRVYGPRGPRVAVVHKGVDCSPCPKRHCANPVCMNTMTIEDVLAAAEGIVSPAAPAAKGMP